MPDFLPARLTLSKVLILKTVDGKSLPSEALDSRHYYLQVASCWLVFTHFTVHFKPLLSRWKRIAFTLSISPIIWLWM